MTGAEIVASPEWIEISNVAMRREDWPNSETGELGVGERSAMALALDMGADLILIDDKSARATTRRVGLRPLGCIGVLHDAYLSGALRDLAGAYRLLLLAGARVDRRILNGSLKALGLPMLD